jgi:hypothetical protein
MDEREGESKEVEGVKGKGSIKRGIEKGMDRE